MEYQGGALEDQAPEKDIWEEYAMAKKEERRVDAACCVFVCVCFAAGLWMIMTAV